MKKQDILHKINENTYQTGSTNPPKNYQGTVAVLLILVIFLGGIISILSLMNIRLFRLLEQKKNSSVQFTRIQAAPAAAEPDPLPEGFHATALGLTGHEVASLYRSYQNWPLGVYISQVTPMGPAAIAGLCPGDILLTVDGTKVDSEKTLKNILSQVTPGQTVSLCVFRGDQELTFTVTAD